MKLVALVTGAGTGLGGALARALAADGFALALHYRNSAEGAEQARAEICAHGGDANMFQADLARESDARQLAADVGARFGHVDVLVNGAGVYQECHGLELSEAAWREGLDSTVTQTYFTTRALLPLLKAGARKRVINIGDSSADRPGARDLAWSYHIGKTGVWMLTRSFAAAAAEHGIAVNMVSPGILENSVGDEDVSKIPAGRRGAFDDVYQAVRFLALDAPAYLTGSNLVVSGGWNLR
ncbi:MAG: SDR family oxidoreductase [Verrucomicrobia bacterium]|nr:SDR family oxidoreductase [Verrucomicrobiota bacterium]